ncbi:putative SPX domain-containing protein [Helianthus annuus]|nr:putative SPX domain-containing protein [Helianthus annuus]
MKIAKIFITKLSIMMPEWECDFIAYKALKKQLKLLDPDCGDEGFEQLLKNELVRMNEFFLRKEQEYTIKFKLKDEAANINNSEDATQVLSDLQQFHNKLNLLIRFHKLNLDAFMKIIKKHKRKTGKSLSFMQEDGQELVFIANPLDKLVAECADLLVLTTQKTACTKGLCQST